MFRVLWEERGMQLLMLLFFGCSIFSRILLGHLYAGLIRETENMAATQNAMLKRCKLKFIRCFQMGGGVNNISVFVDRFVSRLSVGPLSYEGLHHISGQAMLLAVAAAGAGICKALSRGRSFGQILPYYIACFAALYLYFSVSAAVDVEGKKRLLKINMVDYLENHLSARIETTQGDLEELGYVEPGESFSGKSPIKMRRMEKEKNPKSLENIHVEGQKREGTRLTQPSRDGMPQMSETEENEENESLIAQEEWEALLKELMTI